MFCAGTPSGGGTAGHAKQKEKEWECNNQTKSTRKCGWNKTDGMEQTFSWWESHTIRRFGSALATYLDEVPLRSACGAPQPVETHANEGNGKGCRSCGVVELGDASNGLEEHGDVVKVLGGIESHVGEGDKNRCLRWLGRWRSRGGEDRAGIWQRRHEGREGSRSTRTSGRPGPKTRVA